MKTLSIIAAASLVAALVLGEAMLRAIGFSAPLWYQPHPELGWTLRPGMAAWFTGEGRAHVTINAQGRRDAGAAPAKPEGTYRIAVLGDSYSEAMQVAQEETFWALLPERLRACGFAQGKRIEVLNFGVSGYGTAQQFLVLESSALRYQPDLVLLQFTNGNDVKDNSAALDAGKNRVYFRLQGDELEADFSYAADEYRRRTAPSARAGRWLSDYSRLVQLARTTRQGLGVRRAQADAGNGVEQGLEPSMLAPPRDARWDEAWRVTEALIERVAQTSARHGAGVVVLTVPYAIQVHPDPTLRARLQASLGVQDLFYPDHRVAALARRGGFTAVTMAPHLQPVAQERGLYFHGFDNVGMGRGHWNQAGHRAAAEHIAEQLCAEPRRGNEAAGRT